MDNASELGWHMSGSADEVADILIQFAEELRGGDVTVWKSNRELHISPSGSINLSVHADNEGPGKADLRIEMSWGES